MNSPPIRGLDWTTQLRIGSLQHTKDPHCFYLDHVPTCQNGPPSPNPVNFHGHTMQPLSVYNNIVIFQSVENIVVY